MQAKLCSMLKLSIIVPVYNVEPYIRPCFESIFKQGLDENDYEVIIVNDGSTDKSMEMIADIINQHNNITVINQENQGLSVARNNGIEKANGEYILMPDSDDLLIENSLSFLLELALSSGADLVVADFLKIRNEDFNNFQIRTIKQEEIEITEKTGEELFLEDLNPRECYVWHTLFRKLFIITNNIRFFPNINYQDIPYIHECCLKANKCIRTNLLLNIYREGRPGAATESFNYKKARDFCIAIAKTWELNSHASQNELYKLQDDVFTSFSSLLYFTSQINSFKERHQIIRYLKQIAPNLVFTNSIKQKTICFLYKRMPHALISLRVLQSRLIEDRLLPFYRQILAHF